MKKIGKILFVLLLIFFVFNKKSFANNYFQIIFLDVGQGDSILIITPQQKTILIDGGPDISLLKELGKYLPFWKRELDLVLLTHAHDDHFTGLIEVSRRYNIKKFIYNNLDFHNPALDVLKKTLSDKKVKSYEAFRGNDFYFDNKCNLKILSASKENLVDENDYSIVSTWNCLGQKIMLTGDASSLIEDKLIREQLDLKANILKISHHGSLTASSDSFIESVSPQKTVISVGENNKFNHPSDLVLTKLKKMVVDIYRTDHIGSIHFLANNQEIKVINR